MVTRVINLRTKQITKLAKFALEDVLRANIDDAAKASHIVVACVPHHGAEDNISNTMMKLFKPDIYLLESGDGQNYGHPHIKAIRKILFTENLATQSRARLWNNRFEMLEHITIPAFNDSGKSKDPNKKQKAKTIKLTQTAPVLIFSTFISGYIVFSAQGVQTQRSMVNMMEGQKYIPVCSQHIGTVLDHRLTFNRNLSEPYKEMLRNFLADNNRIRLSKIMAQNICYVYLSVREDVYKEYLVHRKRLQPVAD